MAVNDLALSWKDHHGVLISVFEKLLEKKTLVDCTLAAEGKFLKAHKIVLSACSPYLEALLNQENDKHPIIFLRDVQFEDLKTLVEFVYSGEIKIPEDRLVEFLSVAEALQIKGLGGAENEVHSKKPSPEPVRRRETSSPLPRKRARRRSVEKDEPSHDKDTADVTIVETPSQKCTNESQLRITDVTSIPSTSIKSPTTPAELPADIRKVKEEVQNVLTGVSVSIRREQVPPETSTEEILGLKPEFEQVTFTEDYSDDLLPEDSDSVEPVIDQDQPSSSHQYSGFSAEPIDTGGLALEQPYLVANTDQRPAEGSGLQPLGAVLVTSESENTGVHTATSHTFNSISEKISSFECSICLKELSSRSGLSRHIQTHTGNRPYQCSYCFARFRKSSHLVIHTRIHTGERPHQCSYCSASFRESSHLVKHTRIHTGERPYQCSYCSALFRDKSTLSRHIRIHTGERPYKCVYCGKSFNQSNNLKYHLKIHERERKQNQV